MIIKIPGWGFIISMTKIIISNGDSVSIELSGEWLYMSIADYRYRGYLSNLAHLYRENYKDTSRIPSIERILELIYTQDSLRGYRFTANREKLFYTIFNNNTHKKIGEKFIDEFLKGGRRLYDFNGISAESEIYKYRRVQKSYELDIDPMSFLDFVENILPKTRDDMIDRFGVSYIINYVLNTQPGKLDFLINEVK